MKPSSIKSIKAKKARFLLPNFRAITWKGTVYCKDVLDIGLINYTDKVTSDLKSHETIHVRQAESTSDSWTIFYARYLWQWICNLPLIIYGLMLPYYFISFELEAFEKEVDHSYCEGKCVRWKVFNRMSIKEKFYFAREYKKSKMPLKRYVRENSSYMTNER